jgi:hypothetical protein
MILTDWPSLLAKTPGLQLRQGATTHGLARCEERLLATFPAQLKLLYLVSDGVYDQRGHWSVIWSLTDLAEQNERQWAEGGPQRRELLAFGDDGTGIPFCVTRDGGAGVFSWNPIEARPRWVANDLGDFWTGWTTGEITTYFAAA